MANSRGMSKKVNCTCKRNSDLDIHNKINSKEITCTQFKHCGSTKKRKDDRISRWKINTIITYSLDEYLVSADRQIVILNYMQ